METIQQKFAMFIASLSPEEQRAVAPLMTAFAGTLGAPGGAPPGGEAPPLPPPGAAPDKPPMMAPPQTAVPGGPPLPPPDPVAMSIGRQQY